MRRSFITFFLIGGLLQVALPAAPNDKPGEPESATTPSAADGNGSNFTKSPALTGVRRPLYRLRKSDVIEIHFTFSPEFDQTLTLRPDGFVSLKGIGDITAENLTVSELRDSIRQPYATVLHDPEVSIVLLDFEKPFFVAGGQVARPGKYPLRSPTTVAEAIAMAGGFTDQSKHSQVVLFRRITDNLVESHVLNVKAMLASKNLEEDWELKPGDLIYVPQNRMSKIRRFLPGSSVSAYVAPTQF